VSSTAVAHAPETSLGQPHLKVGFWTFLGSECLFFGSLIGTYLSYRGKDAAPPFPHHGPPAGDGILNIPVTSVSTFVLLTSSLAMVLALSACQRGNRKGTSFWLLMTALFGLIFLGFQAYEFTEFYANGLTLQSNLFGSSFFVLTGFHGAHVSVGVLWLLSLLVINLREGIPVGKALNVEIAGLYWHFVDIVWIVIFTVVYLIPD
jgi:cytochrome c oxidase subunit 3/cytochrome o ubiquinol oxidase subunit 3